MMTQTKWVICVCRLAEQQGNPTDALHSTHSIFPASHHLSTLPAIHSMLLRRSRLPSAATSMAAASTKPVFHPELPASLDKLTPEALLPEKVLSQLANKEPAFTFLQLHRLQDQLHTFRQLSRYSRLLSARGAGALPCSS